MYYINVNRNILASNRKADCNSPALSVRRNRSGRAEYGTVIPIMDAAGNVVAKLVQRPDAPMPCGATVYIECLYPTKPITQVKEDEYGKFCHEASPNQS